MSIISMDAAEYAAELGIRSPLMFLRGVRHPDQDVQSDYCVYEPNQNNSASECRGMNPCGSYMASAR